MKFKPCSPTSSFLFGPVLRLLLVVTAVIFLFSGASQTVFAEAVPDGAEPAPLAAPAISVGLGLPGQIFLGDDFSFDVTFDTTGDIGYGPFIDLVFPVNGADGDSNQDPPRDGFDFVSASYLGMAFNAANNNLVSQYFPNHASGTGCVTHPYARINAAGDFAQVCGPSGDRLVTLRLPFGSFTADQPAVTVTVNATSTVDGHDDYADPGTVLTVKARGGFMFGTFTALDDWCCGDPAIIQPLTSDSGSWPVSGSTTPTVMTVAKTYNGPGNVQDETATGPNYPRSYTLDVDIADGETITDLVLTDVLPDSVQFLSVSSTAAYNLGTSTLPSTLTPGGNLVLRYDSVNTDFSVTVNFFVPRLDASSGAVVDPVSGDDSNSVNTVTAVGDWTPNDPRDLPTISVTAVGVPGTHTLENKSIAIQKSYANQTDADESPGDTLKYTIQFQVSDYFAFGGDLTGAQTPADSSDDLGIVVTDLLSDGQRVVPGSLTFALNANPASSNLAEAAYTLGNFDVLCNHTGGPGLECTGVDGSVPAGQTRLVFRVSDEIITRGADAAGRMVGGCINPLTGSATPDCTVTDDGPTTATITFLAQIQDKFTDDFPSGDASVDQGDVLPNDVDVEGFVLDTATFAVGDPETDDGATSITIKSLDLAKDLYALNGSTNLAAFIDPVSGILQVMPGDVVTYRLTYDLFTSDVEDMTFEDYLPLPVFDVDDPDNTGGAGPAWSYAYNDFGVTPGFVPAPGVVSNGPADTFNSYIQTGLSGATGTLTANAGNLAGTAVPVVTSNSANNRVTIAFANYDDTRNLSTTVDLLFSVTVSDDPFADRLYLTNMAEGSEGSTNAIGSVSNAIVQIILTQPVLRSNKTVVWTSNPSNLFSTPVPGAITFSGPSSEPRWSGTVTTGNIGQLESDVSGMDAGDTVTFAIVIQNTGSSLKGAFDIVIQDLLQPEYQDPTDGAGAYPLNLQIYFGDGSGYDYGSGPEEIRYTELGVNPYPGVPGGSLFDDGIQLVDDNPSGLSIFQAHDPTLSNDIIIITYDLYIRGSVSPGQIVNTASLVNYAGEEGGDNHLPEPLDDDATVDVNASPTKSLVATSEVHTTGSNVTIGEIVRYQMSIRLPEATITNLQFLDELPGGLIFLNDGTARVWLDTDAAPTTSDFSGIPAIPASLVNCIAAAPCALADLNISASSNPATNNDTYGNGTDVYFRLANIQNNDRDDDEEFAYIEFNALVHNLTTTSNNNGNNRDNYVWVYVDGVQSGVRSPRVRVTVREPFLTINKTHSSIGVAIEAGDTVTYTVTLANTGSATAFDVEFDDLIPAAYLTLNHASVGYTSTVPVTITNNNPAGPGNTVDLTIAAIPNGQTVTITYQVTATDAVTPGQAIDNEADITWTSLPGTGTPLGPNNPTGSVTPGGSGAGNGERNGSGTNPNDYLNDDTVTLNVIDPLYSKSITYSSAAHTTIPAFAVGEIATFSLAVTLPEGTTPALEIVDDLPVGLAYVANSAELITTAGQSLACPLAVDFAGSFTSGDPVIPPPGGGSGDDVTFDFSTINVTSDGDDTNNTFVVCFEALVVNEVGVDGGDSLINSTDFTIGGVTETRTATVEVVEPVVTIGKTHSSIAVTVEAGDTVTYTVTLENTSLYSAFDVDLEDVIPATYLTLNLGSVVYGASFVAAVTDNSAGNTVDLTVTEIPAGQTVTVTYVVTATDNVTPAQAIDNDASITWTSLPSANTGERNGSGTGPNDYLDDDSISLNVDNPLYGKAVTSSSAVHTTIPAFAVGEIATFSLAVTLPEGTTPALEIVDDLPVGLSYVSGSAELIVTNGQSTACPLAVSFGGSFTSGDPVVTATGASGDDVTFDFGTINVTSDGDDTNNTFVVCFQAWVVNEAGVDDGVSLLNSADFTIGGVTETFTAAVDVVEPFLQIEKLVSDDTPGPGQTVTFTINVSHAAGSHADAFDVALTDVLPAELDMVPATLSYSVGGTSVPTGITDNSSGDTISYTIDSFPLTGTFTITFDAVVDELILTSTFDNIANLTWTSLTGPNGGERTGSGGINDHLTSSTVTLDVLRDLTKSIVADNHPVTATPLVTIGELLTYQIEIEVPPSSTDTFVLTDILDTGLAFVDCEDILADADLSSSTINFNVQGNCAHGLAGNPAISNDGGAIVFDLGTVTNTSSVDYRTITIRYQVVVLDLVDSYDGNGLTYANEVELVWGEGALKATTPGVSIVESRYSLEKTVNTTSAVPGETVVFSLAVDHIATSSTTGYDLVITDVIPLEFEIPTAGLVVNTVSGQPYDRFNYDAFTRTLTIEWDQMPLVNQSLVSFELVIGNVRPGANLTNAANLEWTSLPGVPVEAAGQPVGVQSPYNTQSTERYYDPASPANLTYTASSSISLTVPELPETGFAPGQVTVLPDQPAALAYETSAEMQLEIPAIGVTLPIVGVPLAAEGWNLTWLGSQAGYLEGTAYPTLAGNTGITAHVYTADGLPGPFVNLDQLSWGQEIVIHAYGQLYTYQVRSVRLVAPNDLSVLGHQDLDYLTLITCRNYDTGLGGYRWRTVVQAVLVSVTPE